MGDLILIPGLRSVVKWSHLCTSSPIVPNFHLTELKTSTGSYILTASWLTRSRAAPAVFLLLPTGHVQNRNVQLDPINGSKRSIDGAIGKFLKGFSATSLSLRSLPSSQRQVFRRNLEWLLYLALLALWAGVRPSEGGLNSWFGDYLFVDFWRLYTNK